MTVLLAACGGAAPISGYVIGRAGDGVNSGWIDVAPCTQQPHSNADVGAYCDLSKAIVVNVGPEQVSSYGGGDRYPKPEAT